MREKPVRHGPHFQEEDNHADAQEEKSRPADGGVRRLLDPPPGGAPRPLARADARRAGAAGGTRLRARGALRRRRRRPSRSVLLIAVEKVPDAMVVAMERVRDAGLTNVFFIDADAALLPELFAPGEVDRIYINFCDPWPRRNQKKRRLTHGNFLRQYRRGAAPRRDRSTSRPTTTSLFAWSVEEIPQFGFSLSEVTTDLHADGPVGVMTDYEAKFLRRGQEHQPLRRDDGGLDGARAGSGRPRSDPEGGYTYEADDCIGRYTARPTSGGCCWTRSTRERADRLLLLATCSITGRATTCRRGTTPRRSRPCSTTHAGGFCACAATATRG